MYGWVFGVKLSDEDIAEIEYLRVVATATNFGTKIAIAGFVRTIATRQLVMERSLSGQPTDCSYCRYIAPRTLPWQPLFGFRWANFGCAIAAQYLILGVGFRVKLSDDVIADFEVLRDVAMPTIFGFLYIWGAHWRHRANTTEPSVCGGDATLCQITLTTCYFLYPR